MTTTQEQASGARPQDELSGFWYEGARSFWELAILHNKPSNDLLHVSLIRGVLPKPRIPAVSEEEQCPGKIAFKIKSCC